LIAVSYVAIRLMIVCCCTSCVKKVSLLLISWLIVIFC
jgi:hypothetical protein